MAPRAQPKTNKPGVQRLAGLEIFLCGRLSQPHEDINKIITGQGGTVAGTVSKTTTFLISSQVSVDKNFKAIQDARKHGVSIYLLSCLLDINSNRNIHLIEDNEHVIQDNEHHIQDNEHLIQDNEHLIQDNEHLRNLPNIILQNPKPK